MTPSRIYAFALLVACHIATAEPRTIVCQSPLEERRLNELGKFYGEQCEKYADNKVLSKENCESRDRELAWAKACRESGVSYWSKKTFTLDTQALTGSADKLFAEGFTETCGRAQEPLKKYTIAVTPSKLQFIDPSPAIPEIASFVIDRETLAGGFNGTGYRCDIQKPAARKNKI